jgi:indolepyruvate ferredoxin oxidoreductase alpha subunit
MAERSFKKEVQKLRLGDGEEFHGEGILAVTKALLQSGVSYVAGYQGAPISHLMDVLTDSNDILQELGVHFEHSASEATAAATLAASVHYPLRGAVTFKSTVGTNVASDALANLASGGVLGGALIIVGEDYGEGSSIMQERSHAFAMKSQMWLLDPRPNLPSIVRAVEQGFALSEASSTPVMLELRIRACHVHGRFTARNNVRPQFTLKDAIENPVRDVSRIVLPPASYLHEREKTEKRWPAAQQFIQQQRLNEWFTADAQDFGIILQGGMYNTTVRALELLGLSDVFGDGRVPLYVLNVTYPLVDEEVRRFCAGKRAVLLIEEGQPDFLEQNLHLHSAQERSGDKSSRKRLAGDGGRVYRRGSDAGHSEIRRTLRAAADRSGSSAASGPADGSQATRGGSGRASGPCTAAFFLHRVPGAAHLYGHEAGGARAGPASRQLRHRLPSVLHSAAVQHRRHHHGVRPGLGRRGGL